MKNDQRQLSKTEHWKELINNWTSSGKSIRKWCLENSIPINTFRYWQNKFSLQTLDKKSFVEIVEEKSIPLVIRCKDFEILLDREFDEQVLFRCLATMRSALC